MRALFFALLWMLNQSFDGSHYPPVGLHPVPPPPPLPGLSWAIGQSLSDLKAVLGPQGKIERFEEPTGSQDGFLDYMGPGCAVSFVLKRTRSGISYVAFAVPYTPTGDPIEGDRIAPCLSSLGLLE